MQRDTHHRGVYFFPAHSANETAMQSRPTGHTEACRGLFSAHAVLRFVFFPHTQYLNFDAPQNLRFMYLIKLTIFILYVQY